jgi:predicted metal-binding membrane protein
MESPIDAGMMAKMGMATNQPWTASDVFYTWVMWSVMMIGMMAASTLIGAGVYQLSPLKPLPDGVPEPTGVSDGQLA